MTNKNCPEPKFGAVWVYTCSPKARYRKVTTWARLQLEVGPKWVASTPLVMPFSTAQVVTFLYRAFGE